MNLQESIRRILKEEVTEDKNLYGEKLKPCSKNPMTGFYRDGYCRTGDDDTGSHTVCAKVTEEFLEFTNSMGNNLDMLKPGDKWCLCAKRWEEANKEGVAPEMIKSSTNIKTLDIINGIEQELGEYARTLKNARKQGTKLRFPKSAIKANPQRFRKYTRDTIQESDPKTGTGKKPEGSSRRLYTDENPNDTVSVKFRTKQDIIDTLNKSSFKSKPHKRQSQIINLIHQRVRAAYQNAKDPEVKQRLKKGYDYITSVKEKSKQKTIKLQKQKVNESKSSQHLKLMNNLLDPFKEKDCICDIRVTFDVEENYYDVYLVFGQKELHEKFSDLYGIRTYIQKMKEEVKMELESFLPIRNIFIGYYTKPNCEWSPLNESEDNEKKKIQKNLKAIRTLLDTIDVDGLCEMWVEYNPEDGDYEIRSKTTRKYLDMADMVRELKYIDDTIRSWKLKTYVYAPWYVENCEDEVKFMNESEESKQERKFTKLLNNIEEYLNSNSYNSVVRFMVDYDEVMDDVIVNIFIDAEDAVKLGGGINSVIKKTGKKIMEDLSVFPFDFKYHIHFERPQLNESETKTNSSLHRLLNILFDGFENIYYDWANYGCGMGVCCDPYAIGFTLPEKNYDDYIFKLVDGEMYDDDGDYPKELSDELPEPCYQQPDIKDPKFDTIVFYGLYAEEIEDYMGPERNWKSDLLEIINKQFGCEAKRIIII